jgi:small subunit ribosomal protein S16
MGAKKKPFYRVVVADSRTARGGRFIDQIGYYDPTVEPPVMKIDEEKAKLWVSRGAQPSDTVKALLSKSGVISSTNQEAKSEPAPEPVKKTRTKKTAAAEAEA